MTAFDTILFGLLAGIISLKAALLAAAAVLFVHGLMVQIRPLRATTAVTGAGHPRPDGHA